MEHKQTWQKIDIAGVSISSITMPDLIEELHHKIQDGIKTRICVTPVNCITAANTDPELKKIYNEADYVLCDGVPLIWASQFLKTPIIERITGLDFLPKYIEAAANKGFSQFFLGAKEGVAETLTKVSLEKYPHLKIAGIYSPPFAEKFSDEENNKMIQLINQAKPDILWVSLTAPKQDFWIANHFTQLNIKMAIGVGGAFEVTAGLIKRAPSFYQRNGLEWFYRFLKEPRRLFRRYFIEAPVFIPLILKQKWSKK